MGSVVHMVIKPPPSAPSWLERWAHFANQFEPFRSEALFVLSSLWAAWVLFRPPANFSTFPAGFSFAAEFATETQWAVFACIAACMKLVGLGLAYCRRCGEVSLHLRLIGLAMSGMLWVLFGFSAVVGNPDTLFGLPLLMFGLTAWWLLIRFPTIPAQ